MRDENKNIEQRAKNIEVRVYWINKGQYALTPFWACSPRPPQWERGLGVRERLLVVNSMNHYN